MARRDRHTRIVGWLKIALPLTALAILSTLFLISRRLETPAELPFAEVEMEERARRQQITRPSLTGATDAGDLIVMQADEVVPNAADPSRLDANDVSARIDFAAGHNLTVTADTAAFDRGSQVISLRGAVAAVSSTGHAFRAETVEIGVGSRSLTAPGPVEGSGPEGTWTAGGLTLRTDVTTHDVHLVFTDGVKLVYDPGKFEE